MPTLSGTSPFGLRSNILLQGQLPPGQVVPSSILEQCADTTLDKNELMYSELWHACAGPLVSLPCKGSRVVYLPQGHLEQVAASMKQLGADQQIPVYDIPPQIVCRVAELSLHADRETDEVFAQFTLVPLPQQLDKSWMEGDILSPPKLATHMFCKALTVSDTSTHGGFSVPRRAADECFPPLDYSQQRPSQELVAKDLHGVEWKFRHIYRGQPRRHLLTTGWSVFVGTKRLVAGDSVLFLRRENGELWLGIRRAAARVPCSTPMSVLPSHSMHMGVLAAAAHALSTKSMFNVYYNPRTSPADFVISHLKYRKAFAHSLSVGMRFKMRFESDDGTERRYTGTITGIGDEEPDRWPDSKWRSLKVNWDEHSTSERHERVSPWEIEPFLATGTLDLPIGPGLKRYWSSLTSSTGDFPQSGLLGGSNIDPFGSLRFPKVLQAEESVLPSRNDLFKGAANLKPSLTASRTNDPFAELKRLRSESIRTLAARSEFPHTSKQAVAIGGSDCGRQMSIFQSQQQILSADTATRSASPLSLLKSQQPLEVVGVHNPLAPLAAALDVEQERQPLFWPSLMSASLVSHNQKIQIESLKPRLSPCHSEVTGAVGPNSMSSALNQFFQKSLLQFNSASAESAAALAVGGAESTTRDTKLVREDDQSCVRLFGFALRDSAATDRLSSAVRATEKGVALDFKEQCTHSNVGLKRKKGSSDWEERDDELTASKECAAASSRHRIKCHEQVLKKGHAVGRSVDLSKFSGYPELICALEKLFHMEGELTDPCKGWQITYTDNEGDMMLVGDDPWQEFADIAVKVCILTREELQAVSSGGGTLATSTAHSRSSEQLFVASTDQYQDSSSPTALSRTL